MGVQWISPELKMYHKVDKKKKHHKLTEHQNLKLHVCPIISQTLKKKHLKLLLGSNTFCGQKLWEKTLKLALGGVKSILPALNGLYFFVLTGCISFLLIFPKSFFQRDLTHSKNQDSRLKKRQGMLSEGFGATVCQTVLSFGAVFIYFVYKIYIHIQNDIHNSYNYRTTN